ncbi:helix-turn-helix domain-containing protein [Bacillus sinesaloumensis]|uniref:helix-turn-helix domain-containing protein n=1 Tax=Litchfieldia sinesaloumensis TaxID=1926280 RepID=UPI00098836FD|nr:helix-turn-helix transcriptional regulator [Bacillus sinesaloumensis]
MSAALGQRIRTLRKKRKWTQHELAEKVGISYTYMGEIERAETNATHHVLEKIAHVFEIPVADLVQYTEILNKIENTQILVEIIEMLSSRSLEVQNDAKKFIEIYLNGLDRNAKL